MLVFDALAAGVVVSFTLIVLLTGALAATVPVRYVSHMRLGREESVRAAQEALISVRRRLATFILFWPAIFIFSEFVALISAFEGQGVWPYIFAVCCIFGTVGAIFLTFNLAGRVEPIVTRQEEEPSDSV